MDVLFFECMCWQQFTITILMAKAKKKLNLKNFKYSNLRIPILKKHEGNWNLRYDVSGQTYFTATKMMMMMMMMMMIAI